MLGSHWRDSRGFWLVPDTPSEPLPPVPPEGDTVNSHACHEPAVGGSMVVGPEGRDALFQNWVPAPLRCTATHPDL